MQAQDQQAAGAHAPAFQHQPSINPSRRLWDLQARLHIAGPLSDDEFQRLISQHLRATHCVIERRQEPGIAEHVLPEGWARAS